METLRGEIVNTELTAKIAGLSACPDVTISKADASELIVLSPGENISTTDILDLMTGEEIYNDLVTNGEPQLTEVTELLANKFIYNNSFTGTAKPAYCKVRAAGIIDTETLSNVTSVIYKKINSAGTTTVTIPITAAEGDYIEVTPTVANTALASSVVLSGIYSDSTDTLSVPDKAVSTHIPIFCRYSNTVSIIQESIISGSAYSGGGVWPVNPVVAILSMPLGFAPTCGSYRHVNKSWYVFGLNLVCRIDADPSSATFLNVYNMAGVQNAATTLTIFPTQQFHGVAYDYINDLFCIAAGTTSQGVHIFNPVTNVTQTTLTRSGYDFTLVNHVSYSPQDKCFLLTGNAGDETLYDAVNHTIKYGLRKNCNGKVFSPKYGRYYFTESSNVSIKDTNFKPVTAVTPTSYATGGVAYCRNNDKLIGGAGVFGSGNFLWVLDMATNTGGTRITKASIESGEVNTSTVFWSEGSNRVYAMSGGTSSSQGNTRVHVLHPGQTGNAAYLGYFTVGNFGVGFEFLKMMCNNMLLENG
jgi:hypothetical protein